MINTIFTREKGKSLKQHRALLFSGIPRPCPSGTERASHISFGKFLERPQNCGPKSEGCGQRVVEIPFILSCFIRLVLWLTKQKHSLRNLTPVQTTQLTSSSSFSFSFSSFSGSLKLPESTFYIFHSILLLCLLRPQLKS